MKHLNYSQAAPVQSDMEIELAPFLNKNIKYIISSSEDETIKIWNKDIKVEYQQELRRVEFTEKAHGGGGGNLGWNFNKDKSQCSNVSVQSISPIYDTAGNGLCLLLATRNGDIILMKESRYTRAGEK